MKSDSSVGRRVRGDDCTKQKGSTPISRTNPQPDCRVRRPPPTPALRRPSRLESPSSETGRTHCSRSSTPPKGKRGFSSPDISLNRINTLGTLRRAEERGKLNTNSRSRLLEVRQGTIWPSLGSPRTEPRNDP